MGMDGNQRDGSDPIVRLIDLSRSFGRLVVLRQLNMAFDRGKTTVVLGPSGCGKSVMLKHIVGLLKPDQGEVWFEDTRVDTTNEAGLATIRREVGFLFQQSALFDSMNVRDNIAFPLVEHTNLLAETRQRRVLDVLEMVGMVEAIDSMPAQLSGGQRKRVALARAIVLRPKVILYDEPTTGLDPLRADTINGLILKLQHKLDITSIVVTHDMTSAFRIADVLMMLYDGAVVMQGTPEEFRDSSIPAVQQFMQFQSTPLAAHAGRQAQPGS